MPSIRTSDAQAGDGDTPVLTLSYQTDDIVYASLVEGSGTSDGTASINGNSMTLIEQITSPANVFLWRWTATGSATGVSLTFGGTPVGCGLGCSVDEADTTTPNDTEVQNTSTSASASVTIPSESGDLGIGFAFATAALTASVGTEQASAGNLGIWGSLSTIAGASPNVVPTWTLSSSLWLVIGINVNAAAGGGSAVPIIMAHHG